MIKLRRRVIDIIPPRGYSAGDNKKTDQKADSFSVSDIIGNLVAEPMSYQEELEALLNTEQDPVVELAKAGAILPKAMESGISNLESGISEADDQNSKVSDDFYKKIISHIHAPVVSSVANLSSFKSLPVKPKASIAGFIVEEKIVDFYQNPPSGSAVTMGTIADAMVPIVSSKKSFNFAPPKKKRFFKLLFLTLAAGGLFSYGLTLKNELVSDSSMAIQNLEQAQQNLKDFNFVEAAASFQKSYDDFAEAGKSLNLMGAGIAGIFGDLPGVSKISSAKNMVEAGKLLASSGQAMSEALNALSQTGSILNPHDSHKTKPLTIVRQIKDALFLSTRNFEKAKALISDIDESAVPEDKRASLIDFKEKIPLIEKILADAESYTDFLEGIIGVDEPKKYLVLLQNYSELRPTGGFPGTYGVVSFSSGGLSDFFVDDVYNLDGQLKKNIIPPKQLQHITPTWGMRDSAWFIDFPTSARKAMWFFSQEAGYKVDGVIALNPDIVAGILKVVGPIDMPEYGRTLTADNFLANIQEEVEYGENRTQPKSIVVDFAPRLLEKLYSAGSDDWMKIFSGLMAGLEEKDMMFYFNDKDLEKFAVSNGLGGEVKNVPGGDDYLTVNFSNIKGSKTDIVTDNYIEINSQLTTNDSRPVIKHRVTITRKHNGGDEEHGFYNRQNPAYVRILLPPEARLLEMSGNDLPNFKPLVNYGQLDFLNDQDIRSLESTFYFDPVRSLARAEGTRPSDLGEATSNGIDKTFGVDKFEEAGKQGVGFWMITEPGETKRIEFEDSVH